MEVGTSAEGLSKAVFVSDQGLNAELKNYSWIPCAVNEINTVLRHTFEKRDALDFMQDVSLANSQV